MANDINRVFMIGRLTKDPDLRYTQGGTSVASFSIANNRSYTAQNERKEAVSYFNCIAWGKSGEVIAQHCKKGQRIGIEGRLQQRSWQDQSGQKRNTVEVVVENFQFLDAKGQGGERSDFVPAQGKEQSAPAEDSFPSQQFYPDNDSSPHFSDDDIPF
ncbi:MAG TPA: single-stranded DNA-binding protein [Spirochaetota bacterium]